MCICYVVFHSLWSGVIVYLLSCFRAYPMEWCQFVLTALCIRVYGVMSMCIDCIVFQGLCNGVSVYLLCHVSGPTEWCQCVLVQAWEQLQSFNTPDQATETKTYQWLDYDTHETPSIVIVMMYLILRKSIKLSIL